MKPPRIGFDAQTLTGERQTGLGVYSRGLTDILKKHPEALKLELLWPTEKRPFRRTLERLAWEQYYMVMEAIRKEVDLIHIPAFSVPKFSSIPKVVTAHDMIVTKQPGLMPPGSRWYFGRWIPSTYRAADHIIAVSHTTKSDLVNLLGLDPDDITVIHHGIDPVYTRTTDPHEINRIRHMNHVPMEFFLMVGSFEVRKNIHHAIDAFSRISNSSNQLRLLLVGGESRYQREMRALVKKLELEEKVLFPGYIPDRELVTLYSVTTALLFPSAAEGFGLPLLEAMATGCPVIASDLPVFHEIAGDAAAIVPAGDPTSLAEQMLKMLEDPAYRAIYVRRGLARSLLYNWDHAAEETLRVYLRILKRRGKI
jgi:glycosyltransferase involved in cell wall biosynthesis